MSETGRKAALAGKELNYYERLSLDRKREQEEGRLPKWMATAGYQLFKEKYQWAESYKAQLEAIAETLSKHTDKPEYYREKFFDYMWKGWLSPSTPILSNCGTNRGLIVSCSGQYVEDSIDGFYTSRREAAILTKHGFGTSGYLGDIRHRGSPISTGGKASGIMPVLNGFKQDSREVSQGGVRRGSFAAYIPIDHYDFWEIVQQLEKDPDDMNIGWNISDAFLARLNHGDPEAKNRFAKALKTKMVTGKGYFWFIDKANRALPEIYKKDGLKNYASNLCSEILLPSSKDLTFTCVLASLNVALFDEWKDTDLVEVSTEFLNAVCLEFVEKAKNIPGLENAVRFTEKYKAIGIGVMGFHTYLQKKMMPFESMQAYLFNQDLFELIWKRSKAHSNGRNASLVAVAPTKSTALIMGGVSEGISPDSAMVFTQATAGGEMERVNPVLLQLMKDRGAYNKENIQKIIDDFGSVQNVDFLNDEEKKVFKTAFEINQLSIIRLASARAKYIDQWQSLNLFFPSGENPATIAAVHKEAFMDENIRGLYYVYSKAGVSGSKGECETCAS